MSEDKIRVLIVEARFYSDLADELLRGASQALDSVEAEYEVITVPGARVNLEIDMLARYLARWRETA